MDLEMSAVARVICWCPGETRPRLQCLVDNIDAEKKTTTLWGRVVMTLC